MIKIIVSRNKCMGCGFCSNLLNKEFSMNGEDGLVDLKGAKQVGENLILEINESRLEEFRRAAETCPNLIIKIEK